MRYISILKVIEIANYAHVSVVPNTGKKAMHSYILASSDPKK